MMWPLVINCIGFDILVLNHMNLFSSYFESNISQGAVAKWEGPVQLTSPLR